MFFLTIFGQIKTSKITANFIKKNISEESKLDEIKRYIPNYLLYEVFEKTIE